MNFVCLSGNLTRDPEVRSVKSGEKSTKVANFTLATNRHFTRADGEKDKEVTFVDCEVWDTAAETISKYLKKGNYLLVNGTLKLDSWQNEAGEKRSKLKVRVSNFELGPKPKNSDTQTESEADNSVEGGAEEVGGKIPF